MPGTQREIINQLQKDILHWQGFKAPLPGTTRFAGLEAIEAAFPNAVFPTGTIHEFLNEVPENAAACSGFISGLLGTLMQNGSVCLWISTSRTIFPAALKGFGIEPERVIFIDLKREKDVLWVTEEALKCEGLAAVVAEVRELSFAQSRRLQLAVENSKVTGFLLRKDLRKLTSTTCVARWQITHLPGEAIDGLPGVSFPRWQIELLRVRNGNPGSWQLEWADGNFVAIEAKKINTEMLHERKAG